MNVSKKIKDQNLNMYYLG